MKDYCTLHIGKGTTRPEIEPDTLFLTVEDAEGTYTIPYVQSARELAVSADFRKPELALLRLRLSPDGGEKVLTPEEPHAEFRDLAPAEYVLRAVGEDDGGQVCFEADFRRIGVGTIVAALGDSVTEGYYGRAVHLDEPLELTSLGFDAQYVSQDGRNFPQFAPTSADNKPEVNCFESWMTDLNNMLSETLGQPVFIANEGWGGYTSEAYLKLMRGEVNWQDRMRLLRPTVWLIHLGVNDERSRVEAGVFGRHMEGIIRTLLDEHHAEPHRILVARPCYDYADGSLEYLTAYCGQIDRLVHDLELSPGPDFFEVYSHDRKVWYGEDPVHPNVEGMRLMAELWHGAIVHALEREGGRQGG